MVGHWKGTIWQDSKGYEKKNKKDASSARYLKESFQLLREIFWKMMHQGSVMQIISLHHCIRSFQPIVACLGLQGSTNRFVHLSGYKTTFKWDFDDNRFRHHLCDVSMLPLVHYRSWGMDFLKLWLLTQLAKSPSVAWRTGAAEWTVADTPIGAFYSADHCNENGSKWFYWFTAGQCFSNSGAPPPRWAQGSPGGRVWPRGNISFYFYSVRVAIL